MLNAAGYFWAGCVLVVILWSKYVRRALQLIIYLFVYFYVDVSSSIRQGGQRLLTSIRRHMPGYKRIKSKDKAEAGDTAEDFESLLVQDAEEEEDAIAMWNISVTSEIVDFMIIPISICGQVFLLILILQLVVDSSTSSDNDSSNGSSDNSTSVSTISGPFTFLGSNTIIDISVVVVILQVLFVLTLIYVGMRLTQSAVSALFTWSIWNRLNDLPIPKILLRCFHASFAKTQLYNDSKRHAANQENHPALIRLHETQLKQDLQQENFSSFLDHMFQVIFLGLLFLMVLNSLNIDTTPIWGALAIGGTGAMLASYYALGNLIGTACIFFSDCHRVGDLITLNQNQGTGGVQQQIQGTVAKITPFYTYIYSFSTNYTIVPNSYFTQNVAQVWRNSEMKTQMFYFIFAHGVNYDQTRAFEAKFRELLVEYPEINGNESYLFLYYGDYSTDRWQCVLTRNEMHERRDHVGPNWLYYNIAKASQSRADCEATTVAMQYNKLTKRRKAGRQAGMAKAQSSGQAKGKAESSSQSSGQGKGPSQVAINMAPTSSSTATGQSSGVAKGHAVFGTPASLPLGARPLSAQGPGSGMGMGPLPVNGLTPGLVPSATPSTIPASVKLNDIKIDMPVDPSSATPGNALRVASTPMTVVGKGGMGSSGAIAGAKNNVVHTTTTTTTTTVKTVVDTVAPVTKKDKSKDEDDDEDEDERDEKREESMEKEEAEERMNEQMEIESKGKRHFFVAAQDFYVRLKTWCQEQGLMHVETYLYT